MPRSLKAEGLREAAEMVRERSKFYAGLRAVNKTGKEVDPPCLEAMGYEIRLIEIADSKGPIVADFINLADELEELAVRADLMGDA